jgi:hypothetical protein
VGIAFVDKDYPARAAFGIVTRVQDDFCDQSRERWRTADADNTDAVALLEAAVSKYQVRACRPGVCCPGLFVPLSECPERALCQLIRRLRCTVLDAASACRA